MDDLPKLLIAGFLGGAASFVANVAHRQFTVRQDDLRTRVMTVCQRIEKLRDIGSDYYARPMADSDAATGVESLIKAGIRNIGTEIERMKKEFPFFSCRYSEAMKIFRQALTLGSFEQRPHVIQPARIRDIHIAADDLAHVVRSAVPRPFFAGVWRWMIG